MLNRRDLLTYSLASLVVPLEHRAQQLLLDDTDPDPVPLPMVPARMADEVCENYLINTKFFYRGTVYGHTDAVLDLVKQLGARIVRERVVHGPGKGVFSQQQAMLALAGTGTRWHATVGVLADWPDATAVNQAAVEYLASYFGPHVDGDLSALMHSFGGCNEVDGPGSDGQYDPEWAPHARIMQQALWEAAKAHPMTQSIPVAGPSTRMDLTAERAAELGDLSAWSELGNGHYYHRGTSPTRGIDAHLAKLGICFPQATRWMMTETGYNNSPQTNRGRTVPEEASAMYAVRGIGDYFIRNAVYGRFELLDDPDDIDYTSQDTINQTADIQAHFGLVAMTETTVRAATPDTWRKKPEFYAVQRFLQMMSDRGAPFTPDGLQLQVSAPVDDLQQALVQKRDGRHYLLLWRDVVVATPYPTARAKRVAPAKVRVTIAPQRPVAVYRPRTGTKPVRKIAVTGSFTVAVSKDLLVVEIG